MRERERAAKRNKVYFRTINNRDIHLKNVKKEKSFLRGVQKESEKVERVLIHVKGVKGPEVKPIKLSRIVTEKSEVFASKSKLVVFVFVYFTLDSVYIVQAGVIIILIRTT